MEGAGSYRAILYRVSPRPLIARGAAPASYPGTQCASAAFHRAPSCLPNPIDPKSSGYLFAAAFDAVYTRVFTTTHKSDAQNRVYYEPRCIEGNYALMGHDSKMEMAGSSMMAE